MKHLRWPLLAVLLTALIAQPARPAEDSGRTSQLNLNDLRTFTDVFEQIRQNYIDEVDDATLLRAAIRGMLSETDGYSTYIDPDEFRALNENTLGRKGGIGAVIMIQRRLLVVSSVQQGGPAERAGVRPGDLILAVDGQAVRGRVLADSIDALAGEPGSEVTLRVRFRDQAPRELTLTREWIPVDSVSSEWLEPGIALFRITHFHTNTHLEFREQLQRFQAADTPLRGLVIDLQQNLGGELQSAVTVADGFLDAGLIVRTKSRYPATQLEFHAHEGQWAGNVPVVILVDDSTASSSEVLAAALQDHHRALVVGGRTYGKGSIQSILHLRNGSALRLTTARYYTPSGQSLQDQGIEPDIVTGNAEDSRQRALSWLRSEIGEAG